MRLFFLLSLISISNILLAQQLYRIENALDSLYVGKSEVAFALLNRSATVNNIVAQYLVAKCYEHGIGVSADLNKAFFMYRKTAERGLTQAMADMARCYSIGLGVECNTEKASSWLQRYQSKRVLYEIPDIVTLYKESEIDSNLTKSEYETITTESKIEEKLANFGIEDKKIEVVNDHNTIVQNVILKSDVDVDIPINDIVNETIFALIIANENYQEAIQVDYALNDGVVFSEYCHKILGLPKSNIFLIKDATLNNIKRGINLIQQIADAYNGEASFIIFYAGHGLPDEKTRNSYLLPIDGFVADISTCYGIDDLLGVFGVLPAKKIIVFLDACFSGAIRGNGMLAESRGIAIKSNTKAPQGNTIVISSAQGNEAAYPYHAQKHGLFTYFLLKKNKRK